MTLQRHQSQRRLADRLRAGGIVANLMAARAKVNAARQALAEGADPAPGERQVIQRQIDPRSLPRGTVLPPSNPALANPDPTQSQPAGGGMLGMAPRACRTAQ